MTLADRTEQNPEYARCHYSAVFETADLPVAYCLRSLCQFVERDSLRSPNIAWGGSKDDEWKRNNRRIKLRFTSVEHREECERLASEILPEGTWNRISIDDNDPAVRQRPGIGERRESLEQK